MTERTEKWLTVAVLVAGLILLLIGFAYTEPDRNRNLMLDPAPIEAPTRTFNELWNDRVIIPMLGSNFIPPSSVPKFQDRIPQTKPKGAKQ